jgi:hypothetical protein
MNKQKQKAEIFENSNNNKIKLGTKRRNKSEAETTPGN